jgi:hypothetical protein
MNYTIKFHGQIKIDADSEDNALYLFANATSIHEIMDAIERVDFVRPQTEDLQAKD